MVDLTEYVKLVAASNHYPSWTLAFDTWGRAVSTGILHLAARLAEDDVIEAGAITLSREAGYTHPDGLSAWDESLTEDEREWYRENQRRALATMLANVAEASDTRTPEKRTPVSDPVAMEDEARAEAARINALSDEAAAHGDESVYGVDEYSFIAGAEWQAERINRAISAPGRSTMKANQTAREVFEVVRSRSDEYVREQIAKRRGMSVGEAEARVFDAATELQGGLNHE